MDFASLAALCALHTQALAAPPLPTVADCAQLATRVAGLSSGLSQRLASADARDGVARVAYAEAGNQGDSGLAGVVYTIINRLQDGSWGGSVDAVLNAPHQFEPVMRAGGSWRNLRPVSEAQRAHVETIINLALDGRLPDLTGGARFFQNPRTVASRAAAGTVSARLVNFGGATPTAVIGAHSFYAQLGGRRVSGGGGRPSPMPQVQASDDGIFFGENRAKTAPGIDPLARSSTAQELPDAAPGGTGAPTGARGVEGATTVAASPPAAAGDDRVAQFAQLTRQAEEPSPGALMGDPTRSIFVLRNGRPSSAPR